VEPPGGLIPDILLLIGPRACKWGGQAQCLAPRDHRTLPLGHAGALLRSKACLGKRLERLELVKIERLPGGTNNRIIVDVAGPERGRRRYPPVNCAVA